jgi:hypothetical protein
LHFGPASNNSFWCFVAEQLVVWLTPSLLFYIGGLLLSKSKIRIIDILGTMAFALLPLVLMNLVELLPPFQTLKGIDMKASPSQLLGQPDFFRLVVTLLPFLLISCCFLIWSLVWIYKALKISCNLKGAPLVILYIAGVFGGDIVSRIIIRLFY